jgi:hypothetical protein
MLLLRVKAVYDLPYNENKPQREKLCQAKTLRHESVNITFIKETASLGADREVR